jgi:transposase InsO family protein
LKLEKELVCVLCRHAKMVACPIRPSRVGATRVGSAGGKWYVLVVVNDYTRYAWVFFLEEKGETLGFARDFFLRLKNERHGDTIREIRSDVGSEFKNSHFETFCHDLGLEHHFLSCICPPEWRRG